MPQMQAIVFGLGGMGREKYQNSSISLNFPGANELMFLSYFNALCQRETKGNLILCAPVKWKVICKQKQYFEDGEPVLISVLFLSSFKRRGIDKPVLAP